ncbi:hypothetical protein OSJ57_22675, partial [Sphingomonas sp. HH69]
DPYGPGEPASRHSGNLPERFHKAAPRPVNTPLSRPTESVNRKKPPLRQFFAKAVIGMSQNPDNS